MAMIMTQSTMKGQLMKRIDTKQEISTTKGKKWRKGRNGLQLEGKGRMVGGERR